MAIIAFMIDIEEGHLLPTFPLAQQLQSAGHTIKYLSLADNRELVEKNGFEFHPIFEEYYPVGFRLAYKAENKSSGFARNKYKAREHLKTLMDRDFITDFFPNEKPDLFFVSTFLDVEILALYYKYHIKSVLLTPILRSTSEEAQLTDVAIDSLMNLDIDHLMEFTSLVEKGGGQNSSLTAMVKPLTEFPEIFICPKEFELPLECQEKAFYTGYYQPAKQVVQTESMNAIMELATRKKIIYASLGSQGLSYGSMQAAFVNKLKQVMKLEEMKEYHMVVSLGLLDKKEQVGVEDTGLTLKNWVAQSEVLQFSSLAIIHGGIGSIKECICQKVPMMIVPQDRDQPKNADRVAFHQLGIRIDIEQITPAALCVAIHQLVNDTSVKDGLSLMHNYFYSNPVEKNITTIVAQLLN